MYEHLYFKEIPRFRDFRPALTIHSRFGSAAKDIIRTVKPVTELVNRRTLEKFEVERIYWEQEGVDWGMLLSLFNLNLQYGFAHEIRA